MIKSVSTRILTHTEPWREGYYIFLFLFIFWLILSGRLTLEIVLFGIPVSAAVWLFLCRTLGWDLRRELCFYRLIPHMTAYAAVLAVEIIKANLATLPYALGRRAPDGVTVEFDSPLRSDTANAVLANSITLTPGTITVAVLDGHFTVHCLSPAFAKGIDSSVFVTRLSKMEKLTERKRS